MEILIEVKFQFDCRSKTFVLNEMPNCNVDYAIHDTMNEICWMAHWKNGKETSALWVCVYVCE